ncbi:MAG TPA: GNAT family N-acetyltransferase [Bacilli bacterium]|nr:GNAT family N-acetyltransferase [Bacilli bacterium]
MITEIADINIINKFLKEFNIQINAINEFSHYLVYKKDDEIIGFLNYDLIYDRVELDYIFVVDTYRKNKIASKLMDKLILITNKNNCSNITLEVNISNEKAINLYKKYGFIDAAIRKNYYGNEDGILMIREMI